MNSLKKVNKIELYKEEIIVLYEDSVRSDGFDAEYFNEKITGHLEAAKVDESIDISEFQEVLKSIADLHWSEIRFKDKKVA
jgi:hypothetical protein